MAAIMFITLNLFDAYLTKVTLTMGAVEVNPLMTSIGGNILVKGLVAAALVLILYWFQKERVLWSLNFMFFGVILWNSAVYFILALSEVGHVAISP
jgi:hypothetical protein